MRQNVVVIGATGQVGRELLKQVAASDVPELSIHENPTVVVGLLDSKHFSINLGGFSKELLEDFGSTNKKVAAVMGACELPPGGIIGVPDMMRTLGYHQDLVYVDATALNEDARDLHLKIISETGSQIATANKNPIGRFSHQIYKQLTADPKRYQYSATTMAGLGAVPWLSERHTIQDKIHKMNASLSGTVGFITDALTKGQKLSDAIRMARAKGFTEPDYRDDLNGLDVGRKLIILAREAGFEVNFEDIDIQPFLPNEYFTIADPEACLAKIESELDAQMLQRYAAAAEEKKTLKYLASFDVENEKPVLKVGLKEIPIESAFGKLQGTDNRIEVVTDLYSNQRPYKLEGPGAGFDITASVIRRDLVNLQHRIMRG